MARRLTLGLAAAAIGFCVASTAQAGVIQTVTASDAYYTFGPNVSANSGLRLLADKAADIGFPDLQSISFLMFDQSDLPSTPLGPSGLTAELVLQHDNSLASTLIPASDDRPVFLSVYALTASFDAVNGNLGNIDYGVDGANGFATAEIGDNGFYRWDITELVDQWILNPSTNNGLALSGLFGNVDIDGRNSYGIFHTAGATAGLEPAFSVVTVSEPSTAAIFLMGLSALFLRRRLQR
ncbi:MAG: DNRLRE domain-containing protein [Pseudomonadota bacterium]